LDDMGLSKLSAKVNYSFKAVMMILDVSTVPLTGTCSRHCWMLHDFLMNNSELKTSPRGLMGLTLQLKNVL